MLFKGLTRITDGHSTNEGAFGEFEILLDVHVSLFIAKQKGKNISSSEKQSNCNIQIKRLCLPAKFTQYETLLMR